ncbi:MAG: glycoside hydrolase family 9 protein [Gracilimonas sp.]|nr:glycoside hydrolase family 9 protein [Gracilimonas sp.]
MVNTLGYLPESLKTAFITDQEATTFSLVNIENGITEFESEIASNPVYAPQAGDLVKKIDFSDFTKSGTYSIRLNTQDASSSVFKIQNDLYSKALSSVLESYYIQRCGTEIITEFWSHKACHLNDAYYYDKQENKKGVSGGWHDAGDYNKFAVTHNFTLTLLINQYLEEPHKYFDSQLNIPESGNDIPDILDEIRYGLEWLLKVQHSNGGIHHKVSIKEWSGENLPEQELDPQYIFGISSTATAGAVGVFALGADLFRDLDGEFSSILYSAALKGWGFLESNPVSVPLGGFTNPPDVHGGEYGDQIDIDERLFASVELFKLTKNAEYLDYFHINYKKFWNRSFYVASWQDFRNFAYYSYLNLDEMTPGLDPEVYNDLLSLADKYASSTLNRIKINPYRYALKNNEYYWGSNSIALSYAYDLIQAYKLTNNQEYRNAAKDQLEYILGRNPLGISFVTGVGSYSVKDPYHQFSALNSYPEPVPGMLVGGANYAIHMGNKPLSDFQAKNYEDKFRNYMVNEPAINYTATLSYVLGYFSDPQANKESTL